MLILFLKGAFLGLALAAPVGPINLLCMKRSLEQGQRTGLITGLGAATADTFYGAVAAFGLTFISDWLEAQRASLSLVGGVFFFIIGLSLLRKRAEAEVTEPILISDRSAYFSTVLLTLSNPTTVFSFLAAFAAIKLNTFQGEKVSLSYASFATLGVFVGSMAWWAILSSLSARFRAKLDAKAIRRINIGAGVLLLIFATYVFSKGIAAFNS